MEASALRHQAALPLGGRSPLLRLQSDEKLVALTRSGHNGAFEALVQRYQPRLLAFCRHMLASQEDAEDVLQEVFAAAYNALLGDDRPINARPWLYRIARNRSLNHLRKPRAAGQDSMDVFEQDNGVTTAETVHRREEFRQIVTDVRDLPETQRTALLLREIDALSYDQISEAMDTTVPSVKSLLVRARVSLAEAAEARLLTCEEVRMELGQVAEGLTRTTAPVRRHLKSCERCRTFRSELRNTSKALAAVFPLGPLVFLKKLGIAKLGFGTGAASGAGGSGAGGLAGGAGLATGAAGAAGTAAAGGAISAGASALVSKAAAGMAAAAIVTAGAVEVNNVAERDSSPAAPVVSVLPEPVQVPPPAPPAARATAKPAPATTQPRPEPKPDPSPAPVAAPPPPPPAPAPEPTPAPVPEPAPIQEDQSTAKLPPRAEPVPDEGTDQPSVVAPGEEGMQGQPPAPPAGEPEPSPGQSSPPPPPPGP